LSFVPPEKSAGDLPMALKRILQIVWQGTTIADVKSIKFNELKFHIQYRTQDTSRISQLRPDIQNFMKNSKYDMYPHHEQFYGQQDKIIDSERFSANLFGKLIRVGNNIYERQEYARNMAERKESGDLVTINGDNYYVLAVDNEFYNNGLFQKVRYSKNFNQLANIVTIPSEARFYEVSERSKIRREVRLMEFLELSTTKPSEKVTPRYLNDSNSNNWREFIKQLIFNRSQVTLPNYAWTRFKVDKKRLHTDTSGLEISDDKMFPSSLLDRSDSAVKPLAPSDHSDCIVPLLHYPLHNGIVFEWDMVDNFKAGDFVDSNIYYDSTSTINDKAYLSMQPMRYCDVKGRADLFSFKLFTKSDWDFDQSQALPQAVINPNIDECVAGVQGGDNMGIGLEKDGREELSFNFQINLLHRADESGNDFITFANLFGQKDSELYMCLLDEAQSMFNENVNITPANTLADKVQYNLINDDEINAIELQIIPPNDIDISRIGCVVLYQEANNSKYAYVVKNVDRLADGDKLQNWYIYPVFNNK